MCVRACGLTLLQRTRAARGFLGACVCVSVCLCVRVALRYFKGPELLVDFQVRVCVCVRACVWPYATLKVQSCSWTSRCVCLCFCVCVRVASRYFKGPELLVDFQVRVCVCVCVRACGLTLLQRTRSARGFPGACVCVCACVWPYATSKDQSCSWISRCVCVCLCACVRACGLTLLQRTRAARGLPGACVCVSVCACVWPHATLKVQSCSWMFRCVWLRARVFVLCMFFCVDRWGYSERGGNKRCWGIEGTVRG